MRPRDLTFRMTPYGVTALYALMGITADPRLGRTPTVAHLESTSVHVDGRDNSREKPDEQGSHLTQGDSRDQRPDLHHVMLDVIVEHQAGIPVLLRPLRGHPNDASDFGQVGTHHRAHLHTAHGLAYLVADRALYRAANLQQFTPTSLTWITRVPATLTEAQEALAHAAPEAMLPLWEGERSQRHASHDGGIAQRWVLIYAERRRPQAQRPAAANAFPKLCRPAFACDADAQPALRACMHDWPATHLQEVVRDDAPFPKKDDLKFPT
jgi:hypothetical protein